jgi:hypothetical protein
LDQIRWTVTTSAVANSSSFSTRRAPASAARSSVRFWLQDVDGLVPDAGGDQQLQVGQPLEDLGTEPGPLAHRDDHVEGLEAGDQRVGVRDVVVELDDVDRFGDLRPVGEGVRDGLVVVEDGDAVHSPGLLRTRLSGAPEAHHQAVMKPLS